MSYELIETFELSSTTATISFQNIPQDGQDLALVMNTRVDRDPAFGDANIVFNNDTSGSYSRVQLVGTGSTNSAFSITGETSLIVGQVDSAGSATGYFTSSSLYLTNYTDNNRKFIDLFHEREANDTAARLRIGSYQYTTTSPITQIDVKAFSDNYVTGSVFSLYKITAA